MQNDPATTSHPTPPQDNIPWDLLAFELAGECTPAEKEQLDAWRAANPGHEPLIKSFGEAWENPETPSSPPRDLAAIEQLIVARAELRTNPAARTRKYPKLYQLGAISGCCLVAFAVWKEFRPSTSTPNTAPATYTTYTTTAGQRASLTLANGAKVTLGPLTTLRVPKSTVSSNLAVEVNGEALFNVAHAANNPFTVTAHGVTARVLGTEFVVRAYDPSLVRVAVRDGRVSVQSSVTTSANAAIANAGEAVSVTPNTLPVVTAISDIPTDFAWANGELILRSVPLGEAFVRLSRWYGMEFRVTDAALLNEKVNAVFPSTFNPDDIDWLGTAIHARVTRSGNTILFSKNP